MAEILRRTYSSVVPFSCIPARFTEPLMLESAGEYTLDKTQFPGLMDEEHALQPALLIAPVESYHQTKLPAESYHQTKLPAESYHQTKLPVSEPNHGHYRSIDCQQNVPNHQNVRTHNNLPNQQVLQDHHQHTGDVNRHPLSVITSRSTNLPSRDSNTRSTTSSGPDVIHKARQDLFTILSGLQEKDFGMNCNPFDAMPALLSAVTYDYVQVSTHPAEVCRSNARISRQAHFRRKRLCHMTKVQDCAAPALQHSYHDYNYLNNSENIPQMLQHGQSRKRSYQVDDLDDILLREYGANKKRKTMPPQCHQELFPVADPILSFAGGHGIVGY